MTVKMAATSSVEDLLSYSDAEADSDVDSEASDEAEKILGDMLGELETLQMALGDEQGYGQSTSYKSKTTPVQWEQQQLSNVSDSARTTGKCAESEEEPKTNSCNETYRKSKSPTDEAVDLDELLGELCMLENALSRNSVLDLSKLCDSPSQTSAQFQSPKEGAVKVTALGKDPAGQVSNEPLPSVVTTGEDDVPDNDSAFCDYESLPSSESCTSTAARADLQEQGDGTSSTATETSTMLFEPQNEVTEAEEQHRLKTDKIRIALEKIKEANIKKLYVKVFSIDGNTKSLLVDERQCCGEICTILSDKFHVPLSHRWCLIEILPDLCMERIYEDHESVVKNLLYWTRESTNKLVFAERDEKYDLFQNPQNYLLMSTSSEHGHNMSDTNKERLVEEFFVESGSRVPDTEGILHLKIDGKKAWKKHYFVLRASGLYYVPKGKTKNLKDLVCLMKFDMVEIYHAFGWKKKYKAPTDFGFALKHPQIMKAGKHIKYMCAEDESTFKHWVMAIRIVKFGKQLYDNWHRLQRTIMSDASEAPGERTFRPTLNGSSNSLQGSIPGVSVLGIR